MSTARTKRKRRTDKQVLVFGPEAKRAHRRVGGRTGGIRKKQTPTSAPSGYQHSVPLTVPESVRLMERKKP